MFFDAHSFLEMKAQCAVALSVIRAVTAPFKEEEYLSSCTLWCNRTSITVRLFRAEGALVSCLRRSGLFVVEQEEREGLTVALHPVCMSAPCQTPHIRCISKHGGQRPSTETGLILGMSASAASSSSTVLLTYVRQPPICQWQAG